MIWQKRAAVLFYCFILTFNCKSQSFSKNDIDSIQFKIFNYLQTHETPLFDSTYSEIILVILQTDAKSNFSGIHLLADGKNKGTAYRILSKMTINDLKDWHPQNFPNKSIIVPVYSTRVSREYNYADSSFWDMKWAATSGYIVNKDQRFSVMLSGISYYPPFPSPGCGMDFNNGTFNRKTIAPNTITSHCPIIPPGISKDK